MAAKTVTAEQRARMNAYAREYNRRPEVLARQRLRSKRPSYIAMKERNRLKRIETKPWVHIVAQARMRAKKKRLPYALTTEWIESRWTGHCELTGLPFVYTRERPNAYSPSIDRINPREGYTPENTRFVLWSVNQFKGRWDDASMLHIARTLVQTNSIE